MDRRERIKDPEELLRSVFESLSSQLWTALPGIIQSYNGDAQTVSVQPSIQGVIKDVTGAARFVDYPLLLDVPCQFLGGGGFTQTWPVAQGDECLVVFASRCIDAWWQQGGIQPPMESRSHDLSDGFAILGFRSQPRILSNVSITSTQIRSDNGQTYIDLSASTIRLVADEVYVHGRNKAVLDANGTGIKFEPNLVTTTTDTVPTAHSEPTPPQVT